MFNVSFSHLSPFPYLTLTFCPMCFYLTWYFAISPSFLLFLSPTLHLSPYALSHSKPSSFPLSFSCLLSFPLSHSKPSFFPLSRPLSKFILHQPHLIFPPSLPFSLPFSLSPYPLPPFPSISLGTLLFHPLSYYHFTSFPLSRPLCKFILHQPHF